VDWKRLVDDWKQITGTVKERWGKLTNSNLAAIEGQSRPRQSRQQRYGNAKAQFYKDSDGWFPRINFFPKGFCFCMLDLTLVKAASLSRNYTFDRTKPA
jgi:uncharacterized protein YjbJ (UPF0337 family)